jgi:hypothetical protein
LADEDTDASYKRGLHPLLGAVEKVHCERRHKSGRIFQGFGSPDLARSLILRSRASGVSKDEASWFEMREDALLTMRV